MKAIGGLVLAVFGIMVLFALGWAIRANFWAQDKVFLPQEEAVRRETFEQSKAYNQGAIQELQNMQFEYVKSDDNAKKALAPIILHRAADFDVNKLPDDLRHFINSLK